MFNKNKPQIVSSKRKIENIEVDPNDTGEQAMLVGPQSQDTGLEASAVGPQSQDEDEDEDEDDEETTKKQKTHLAADTDIINIIDVYEADTGIIIEADPVISLGNVNILQTYLRILAKLTNIKKLIVTDTVVKKSKKLTKILTKLIGTDEFLNLVYDFANISNPELNALLAYESTLIQFMIKLKTTQIIINVMKQLTSPDVTTTTDVTISPVATIPADKIIIYQLIKILANDQTLMDITKKVDKLSIKKYLRETLGCMFGFVFGDQKLDVKKTLEENYLEMYKRIKDTSIKDFLNNILRIEEDDTETITIESFNELQPIYILRKFIYKLLSPITEQLEPTEKTTKKGITTTTTKTIINAQGFEFNPPFPPNPFHPTLNPVATGPPKIVEIAFVYIPPPDIIVINPLPPTPRGSTVATVATVAPDPTIPLGKFKDLCNKVEELFRFDYNTYNAIYEDDDVLKPLVRSLYEKLKGYTFFNLNNAKYTYTFIIKNREIVVEHNLFGDLFMIRCELPHDFKDFYHINLFKQIINLSIQDYIYTTFSGSPETLVILENILTIPLNEPTSAMAVLELIFLSGIPLIKQQKNKLVIEVDNNENDACIFPLIFNGKKVQIVSDADSQGNKYFSQVEDLISALESIYPFLKFDAGSSPTFYSFKELAERLRQLEKMDTTTTPTQSTTTTPDPTPEEPLIINVKCLDGKNYIHIGYVKGTDVKGLDKYTYSIEFIHQVGDTPEITAIIDYLNGKPDILKILDQDAEKKNKNPPSSASITAVISMLNNILKALYLYEQAERKRRGQGKLADPTPDVNEKTLSAFLQQQITLYETYINLKKVNRNTPVAGNTAKAKFICNILLNIISIKSLGDLVPYYVTLMQIMYDKQTLPSTTPLQSKSTLKPTYDMNYQDLYTYFMELPVEYFGALGSADYSLIQSALINVIFDDPIKQQQVDDCEMVSCVHINNSDITLPISKKEKNIFRLMSCIANTEGSCRSRFKNIIDKLTEYSSLVDFMNIKEKREEIGKFLSVINKNIHDYQIPINIPDTSMTEIQQCEYFKDNLKTHVRVLLTQIIRNVPEKEANMEVDYEQAILDALKDSNPPDGVVYDENIENALKDEGNVNYHEVQTILDDPNNDQHEIYKFHKNKITINDIEITTKLIKKLDIILSDFKLFIHDIIELNNVIKATTNVAQFFEDLEIDSKPREATNNDEQEETDDEETTDNDEHEETTDNDEQNQQPMDQGDANHQQTTNITINNPNIYFLCEYIVRNLNYILITQSPQPPSSSGSFSLGAPSSSGSFSIGTKTSPKTSPKTPINNTMKATSFNFGNQTVSHNNLTGQPVAMEERGGNPKKSTKFKITKKHNKKQYKKRTRKYLHKLK